MFTQRHFQVKMNKKTLFEYKCSKKKSFETLLSARNIYTQCYVNKRSLSGYLAQVLAP